MLKTGPKQMCDRALAQNNQAPVHSTCVAAVLHRRQEEGYQHGGQAALVLHGLSCLGSQPSRRLCS
jgi:hypothetical protein